jgi:hypothetical protein
MNLRRRIDIVLDHVDWHVGTARSGDLIGVLRNVVIGAVFLFVFSRFDKIGDLTYLITASRTFQAGYLSFCYWVTLVLFLGATSYFLGTVIAISLRRARGRVSRLIKLHLVQMEFVTFFRY